jgi:hypothetical protein
MAIDQIRYDLLAQDALRGVVRRVLQDAMRDGLPGDHHFFVAFDTRAPGVRLSPRLLERYPEEMTIVLQHQFWNLSVSDYGFEVGLSFSGVPEMLFVPFSALKGFFDPSVQFGLQFEVTDETAPASGTAAEPAEIKRLPADTAAPRPASATSVPQIQPVDRAQSPQASAPEGKDGPVQDGVPEGGATIVQFDRFRKK